MGQHNILYPLDKIHKSIDKGLQKVYHLVNSGTWFIIVNYAPFSTWEGGFVLGHTMNLVRIYKPQLEHPPTKAKKARERMEAKVNQRDLEKRELLLSGNILRGVLSVCLPMAAFQLLNEIFRVFDLGITAQIDPSCVSAVSSFNQLSSSFAAVGNGLAIGAGILIAGYYGAGEYQKVKKTVNTSVFLAVVGSAILATVLFLSGRWVLGLVNTPPELIELGLNYYRVVMLNLVFVFFNAVYIAVEKARGNGGRILAVNLLMAVVKLLLSALFILVLHQGVVMIAVSTLLANLAVTALGCFSLRDSDSAFGLSLRSVELRSGLPRRIFKVSVPVMAEKFAFSAGKVVVNAVGFDYGTQTVGALGVSNSISALSTVPAGTIGDGGAAVIRQNIGNDNKERALRVFGCVFLVDVIWGIVGFLVTWVFLDPILLVFAQGDSAFALLIREIFVQEMLSNIFLSVHAAVVALLYAFAYTKLTFALNFSRLFVFRIPVLFLFQRFTDLPGGRAMGLVMMLSNAMTGLFALLLAVIVLRKEYDRGWLARLMGRGGAGDQGKGCS